MEVKLWSWPGVVVNKIYLQFMSRWSIGRHRDTMQQLGDTGTLCNNKAAKGHYALRG